MDFDLIHGIMKEPENHIIGPASSMRELNRDQAAWRSRSQPEIPSTARSSRALSNTGEK